MNKDQKEMQLLGFFGIYKESFNLIRSNRRIFTKITLTLILPLSFLFLAHRKIFNLLITNTDLTNDEDFDQIPTNTFKYYLITNIEINEDDFLTTKQTYLSLFSLVYFFLYSFLCLFSTSAIVYTVACIFTARDLTFRNVTNVVPRVWKRLIVTFFLLPLVIIAYTITVFLELVSLIFFTSVFFGSITTNIVTTLAFFYTFYFLLCFVFGIGLIYILLVWNIACVVSVLEDLYGVQAMMKSVNLIKGKLLVSMAMFFMIYFSFFMIMCVFQRRVEGGFRRSEKVCYAILCLLVISMLNLLFVVVATVIYFVCKSYHGEKIDKVEYVPLKAKDVHLEKYYRV